MIATTGHIMQAPDWVPEIAKPATPPQLATPLGRSCKAQQRHTAQNLGKAAKTARLLPQTPIFSPNNPLFPLKPTPKSQTLKQHDKVMSYQGCAAAMTPDQFKTEMISLLPRLRRFAMSLTRSGPDADDLLQDACAAALQKWHTFDPAQPLDRWLFRIIRNLWVSEIRKRKVRQGEGQVPAEEAAELRTESNVDDVMTAKQVNRHVEDLENDLSQPLLLVCAEGYSYREASELLNIPIGTVMSRIHRARKLLVSRLTTEECVE